MDPFPTTRWTQILQARTDSERGDLLRGLLTIYWKPLYVFARAKGLDAGEAEEAVQAFSADLLQRGFLQNLDPGKGRLRAYLKSSFSRFVGNQRLARNAAKRGGRVLHVDFAEAEGLVASKDPTPEAAYDRAWAQSLLDQSLERLWQEYESGKRTGPVEAIRQIFSDDPPSYAKLAERYDMTIPQVTSFMHRARKRYREIVLEEVRDTLSEGNPEAELNELLTWVSSG